MDTYFVYKHTAPSGRVYIGISKDPEKRWNKGKGYRYNLYFWRCIQKYGWDNISHEILFSGLNANEAKQKEVELIAKHKSNEREFGYNISGGGDGAVAEETREKMSIARIGNRNSVGRKLRKSTRDKISSSLKGYYAEHEPTFSGRHHSQETIEKLKSRVFSKETKRKMSENHADVGGSKNPSAKCVSCFSIDGKYIKTYPYAKLASVELHIDLSALIKCCRGKSKTCGGFIWKYGEPGIYGWNQLD